MARAARAAATMDKEADSKYFAHDEQKIEALLKEEPWKKDPKNFRKCKISALAGMRMLKHSLRGVEKGRARDQGKGGADMHIHLHAYIHTHVHTYTHTIHIGSKSFVVEVDERFVC